MIKIIIIFIFLLTGCSFDSKTGIWDGLENDEKRVRSNENKQNRNVEIVQVYTSQNIFSKEIVPTGSITLTKPIKNTSWETANLNTQNKTGNILLTGVSNNFLKKKVGKNKFLNTNKYSSPLYFKENIIFADDVGNIFNINNKGKINWKVNIYKNTFKKVYKNLSFSLYKNKIYVADNIGFVYSLNFETGKVIWLKSHGIPIKSKIKVFENKIFLINQDNKIFCLDAENGNKIWDLRTISSFIKSQNFLGMAISKSGDVLVLTSAGDLLKIKSTNGRLYWSLNTAGSMSDNASDFFQSSDVVISDDDVFLSTLNSTLSLSIKNGYFNWEQKIGSTNNPIIDGKNIFLVTNNGFFVNLKKKSGKIIWSVNLLKNLKKKKQETSITGFVLGSGKIYATTLNGFLIVCSAATGKIEFSKKIGNKIIAPPIIVNNSLFVLTEKSEILGFN